MSVSTNSQPDIKPNQPTRRLDSSTLLVILVIILLLISAGFSAWKWHKDKQVSLSQQQELLQLQDQVANLTTQIQDNQQQLTGQQEHLSKVLNTATADNMNWQLNEARYLIHLANFSVDFEHNVTGAIVLLQTADNRLATLDAPDLMDIRQALTNDISALKAVPEVDISNILLQLNALGGQIAQLPVISTPNSVPQAPQPKHHHHHQPGWKRGLAQSWQQLKQIIVVQYHDQPVGELITPQHRDYLDLHLQMLFAQAEWACLHQQEDLYNQSIQQAINWVKNYYVESAPQSQAMLTQLQQLQQNDIAPTMPVISDSLVLINKKINVVTPPNEVMQ